jgi:hypothetical protein
MLIGRSPAPAPAGAGALIFFSSPLYCKLEPDDKKMAAGAKQYACGRATDPSSIVLLCALAQGLYIAEP